MPERLCASCSAWFLAPDDAWCGNCRAGCAQLSLEIIPSVLHIGHIAPRLGLKLTNPTCAPLSIEPPPKFKWIVIDGCPAQIGAGENIVMFARAATLGLNTPDFVNVVLATPAGSASALVMALAEKPVLAVVPSEVTVWREARSVPQRIGIKLRPPKGYLRVTSIRSHVDWLSVASELKHSVLVGPDAPLSLDLDVLPTRPETATSSDLTVEYEDPHALSILTVLLKFISRNAPELRWEEKDLPPPRLTQMDQQNLAFTVYNQRDERQDGRSNAPVIISGATLSAGSALSPLVARCISSFPLILNGGQSGRITFDLNLESYPTGIHRLELRLDTNSPELSRRTFEPRIDVGRLADFDGVIAIDFGTSNTCCAILPRDEASIDIRLDHGKTIAPTLVRYLNLKEPFPDIETGAAVKELAAKNAEYAASKVDRLKQELGEVTAPIRVRPAHTGEWVHREARLAARDYFHYIRAAAERDRQRIFREFILTHPAVCSIRQYNNLRSALREAFGSGVSVSFLQEPIAALMPFFDEQGKSHPASCYSVAAFDLGGGTTDITVVRVTHQQISQGISIHPRIETSWGERFGGEHLTDFLVEQISARCSRVIAASRTGFRLAAPDVPGASRVDSRRNEAALREWAEQFKAAMSDEPAVQRELDVLILLVVSEDTLEPAQETTFTPEEIGAGEAGDLRPEFQTYCASRIRPIAERLQSVLVGKAPLDFIYLSGKSTYLPIVRQTLQAVCSPEIRTAKEPKACVVRGACLSRVMQGSPSRRLVLPAEIQRTTSSIGVMNPDTASFVEVIRFDTPLPPNGLVRERTNAWNGYEVVVVWENLGVELAWILPGGAQNLDLKKFGVFQSARLISARPLAENWWTLRFSLSAEFNLTVSAVGPSGDTVVFTPRETGGL